MTKAVTEHFTEEGEVLFMAVSKAFKNAKTGKEEFSVKVKLDAGDPAVKHLRKIAGYKVDTKTNRALEGTGEVIINFSSTFAPLVVNAENVKLEGKDIPFFDSRKDKAKVVVGYKVVDYGNNTIVRLSVVKLKELVKAPRDSNATLEALIEKLKTL